MLTRSHQNSKESLIPWLMGIPAKLFFITHHVNDYHYLISNPKDPCTATIANNLIVTNDGSFKSCSHHM